MISTSEQSVEEAMNRVFIAETTAHQAIERSKQDADVLLLEAQSQARRIQERTDQRINAIQKNRAKMLKNHIKQLLQDEHLLTADMDTSPFLLQQAVLSLVEQMVGKY